MRVTLWGHKSRCVFYWSQWERQRQCSVSKLTSALIFHLLYFHLHSVPQFSWTKKNGRSFNSVNFHNHNHLSVDQRQHRPLWGERLFIPPWGCCSPPQTPYPLPFNVCVHGGFFTSHSPSISMFWHASHPPWSSGKKIQIKMMSNETRPPLSESLVPTQWWGFPNLCFPFFTFSPFSQSMLSHPSNSCDKRWQRRIKMRKEMNPRREFPQTILLHLH